MINRNNQLKYVHLILVNLASGPRSILDLKKTHAYFKKKKKKEKLKVQWVQIYKPQ